MPSFGTAAALPASNPTRGSARWAVRGLAMAGLLIAPLACGDGNPLSSGSGSSAGTGSATSNDSSNSSSASDSSDTSANECAAVGGVCQCGCSPGSEPIETEPSGLCPPPPPGSDACSTICCAPSGSSGGSDTCGDAGPAAGETPVCGQACVSPCGDCQFCAEGTVQCARPEDGLGNDVMLRCSDDGSCYEPVDCAEGYTCQRSPNGQPAACTDALDCEQIELIYEALVERDNCQEDADCRVLTGHCEIGLGSDCYHGIGNTLIAGEPIEQSDLDELAARFTELGCPGTPCAPCEEAPAPACVNRCTP